MFQRALSGSGGGGGYITEFDVKQGTASGGDSVWISTTIPSEDVYYVYVKSNNYTYYGCFAVVNNTLEWVNGTKTTYEYLGARISGSYLEVCQRFSSGSQPMTYVVMTKP